ncbi:hypothetical protein [Micromonospora fulviviridis]|uniref:hypothetical protein n=1 Tax=Micromonospora fulviviridis TaxID=47860 RepID=UPI00166B2406|nr:hypothetical protein [Micromonospora fulviviridis]
MSREEALRLADEPVTAWTNAEVEYEPRPVRNTFLVELSEGDLTWLFEEAQRRGVKPSAVIQALMSQARRAAESLPADQEAGDGSRED